MPTIRAPRRPSRNVPVSLPRVIAEALERRVMLAVVPLGSEFRVNTYTTNGQTRPAIAMQPDGDFVVVWSSNQQDGSLFSVYAQRYNGAAQPLGPEFRVNTYTTGVQGDSRIAADADGNFVITWYSSSQDGSDGGCYAQRYNAAGQPQGSEFRVNTYTSGPQIWPRVAMNNAGDFAITWASHNQDGSGYGIYAKRYNAAGAELPPPPGVPTGLGNEFRVSTYTAGDQQYPSIAMDNDGDFVITWHSYLQDGSDWGVYAQRFSSAGGEPQGSEIRVNSYTTGRQWNPAVGMDADGDFVIAWESMGQSSFYSIYAQRYNAAGEAQNGEFRVNSNTHLQDQAAAAMDGDGDFIITWRSEHQDGSGFGVYSKRYDASGQGLPRPIGSPAGVGDEFRVNTHTPLDQWYASVATPRATGATDFVITWQSRGQDGSDYGIFAQRYGAAPNVAGSSFLFATAPHRLQFAFDENVAESLGSDDVVVQNLTTGQTIPSTDFALTYDLGTNTATLDYAGAGGGVSGVMPDGNYRATLLAAGVTTPNGTPLPADHVLEFFFLNGDANHDGRVNLADFNILAANFGQSGPGIDFTRGDFTYDGIVNLADFNVLAGRFGVVLARARPPSTIGSHSIGDGADEERDVFEELAVQASNG